MLLSNSNVCILCDTQSRNVAVGNRGATGIMCPKCGVYGFSWELTDSIFSQIQKFVISGIIYENSRMNKLPILLAQESYGNLDGFNWIGVSDLLALVPKSLNEIIDRTLLNLASKISFPADQVSIDDTIVKITFSGNVSQSFYIFRQMELKGYTTRLPGLPGSVNIESKGWDRIESLKHIAPGNIRQCFVAMWFDKTMNEIYENGIKAGIECGGVYRAKKINDVEHNNKICDEIVGEIKKSKFLVADFTGGRGGVYYEAGLAHGLGMPVIWTVRNDWVNELHFDTRQYNHIVYSNSAELKEKLQARISATIA